MPQKKIILASASPQRKKLLKFLGLKFSVCPSRVEEVKKHTFSCSRLVMKNASLKAEDIAARNKEGIVIGADTLVYDGKGKVIGKPKNLKEAKSILKRMARQPHWVYTGLTVIDAKTKKKIAGYEKTKVFMNCLSNKEIDRYHNHLSPLDKAGGFDIEGRGGLFINRIEGCYYNVIGLPLAKLCAMLKKVGVSVLMMLCVFQFTGCTSEYNLATHRHERLMYSTEREIAIGNAVSNQIEKNYEIIEDIDVNERLQKILDRIVAVCDRQDILYKIKAIDEDIMNAVSLPGGYIYVFKGLIDRVDNDDQLAGVIAHEVGHITARHGIKRLQASYGYALLQVLAVESGDADFAQGVQTISTITFLEYSQADEFESDKLGVKYIRKAGYDLKEMPKMLERMQEYEAKQPRRQFSYWRTHPHLTQRIAVVNREIGGGKLEFKDYLNLTGNE